KRAFVLSPDLRPCRHNVLQYDYARGNYADRWFYPATALAPPEIVDANRATVQGFVASIPLAIDPNGQQREQAQRHLVCRDISLARVVSELIVPFRVTSAGDTNNLIGVMLQLSQAL